MKIYIDNNGNEFKHNPLLPCPFCGCSPELLFIGNNYTKSRKVIVKCKMCRVQRTDATLRHDQEWAAKVAINNWNQRIHKI